MRPPVIIWLLVWLLSVPLAAADLPPIVFYITDDLSHSDISPYGYSHGHTPNLDRLAGLGLTFEQAFIASPACAPSRAALLTGLMPARNGAEANHTYPREEITFLTQSLRDQGYRIAAFGKVAHGATDESTYQVDHFEDVPKRGDLSGAVRAYVDSIGRSAPLCLLVGDKRPHVTWVDKSRYDPDQITLPPYFIDTKATREHWGRYLTDIEGMDRELGEVLDLTQELFGEDYLFLFSSDHGSQWPFAKWNLYDAGIRVPLIVAWPGEIAAGSRTAAMVSWVDIFPTLIDIAGGTVPEQRDGVSFKKALLAEADDHREYIYTTHSGDGVMNVFPVRSVRTSRYKYIRNLYPEYYHSNHSDILRKDGAGAYWDSWNQAEQSDPRAAAIVKKYYVRPAEEFYDLQQDPREQTNLIEDPQHQSTIKKLSARLDAWMVEQGDQKMLYNEPYPVTGPRPTPEMAQTK